MTDLGVIAIAHKEFFDHLRSRKFLLILGILLVIAIIGILNGISDYNTSVAAYNNLQIAASHDWGTTLTADLYQKIKPSALQVFYQMSTLFAMIGGILGIAMGFDLVTKEKESRSLKILLAHPVYRDEVINGKALGGIAAILLGLGCVIAVSLGVLLIFGIVPDISELLPLLVFCAVTFLFIFTYFAIALLMSTLCEESGRSLVYTLVIFVTLGSFIPAVVSSPLVMDQVIGPMPELPKIIADPMMKDQNREALNAYDRQTQEYGEKQMKVADLQYLLSPDRNYVKITSFLTSPEAISNMLYPVMGKSWGSINETSEDITVGVMYEKLADFDFSAILAMIIGNIIALLIQPVVFFGLAYVSFMRMDIR
ncbi:MAG: ABC transporter permease [Methanoregula sp.]|jgi:ABC-2 type transport system permease protein|nr:ABC transporter permease [Methanoregula sp.]